MITFPRRLAQLLPWTSLSFALAGEPPVEIPTVTDNRIQITLYAGDPQIVTPIGAAVDARGRLFVLESHTHLRPASYTGPKLDLIKIYEGVGPDGRAARVSVFADDVHEGMNLAFAPDGTLYVCAAQEVFALPDRDADSRADPRRTLLRLDTKQTYPHSQLLGLTIAADGWLYASRGNTGGLPYAWIGADGTRLPGYGDGGDIVRCRLDGTGLESVATGFWNPFDLKFDAQGRLLALDNDPDSRGPNRLLHIVPGGNYGYRSLYGTSGLHPYQAWNGDLPDTLPYIVGVGESPSGLLDTTLAAFPKDFAPGILATIWGEHTITLHRLQNAGTSLRGDSEVLIRGGQNFRPVALAAAPDGTVYLTDWVLSGYPNHGRGRIWKITTRSGVETAKPRAEFTVVTPDAGSARLARLRASATPQAIPELRASLADSDPFVRHAAITALAQPVLHSAARRDLEHDDPAVRLGALLALRRADVSDAAALVRPRLRDPDADVRQMALMWTGEKLLKSLSSDVDVAVTLPNLTPRLFETWLATVQILQSDAEALYAAQTPGGRIKRPLDPAFIASLVADEDRPALVRILALPRLDDLDSPAHHALLLKLSRAAEPALQIQAIGRLASSAHPNTVPALRALAHERQQPPEVRAEAILALTAKADASLVPLLNDPAPAVRIQAARTLRFAAAEPTVREAGAAKLAEVRSNPRESAFTAELNHLLNPTLAARPGSVEGWQQTLATGGDPAAGRRVFFAMHAMCAMCHRIDGRGGQQGPDLSVIGRTANRDQLIRSIVKPSDDIAPQFQGWEVRKTNGEVITGLQGHIRTGRGISIIPLDGMETTIPEKEVAYFGALDGSLMPEGLEAMLSIEEFRDLIAFLATRR